ncbi:MAG: SDR family oxidoreductase [Synergistetes bacterium]|nr:SDR family oxidoreductase [Synergistota bacterium]
MFNLEGMLSLVTGGSRGIGRALAEGLAEAGSDIILVSRSEEVENVALEIWENYKVKSVSYRCDVSSPEEVRKMIRWVEGQYGKLDVVVNAAGINKRYPAEEFPIEDFKEIMEVNLLGTFYVCKEAFRLLRRSDNPSILNVCSLTVTEVTVPNICAYAASKGAIASLTKALATEWGRYGIRVNAVAPGWFETKMTEAVFKDKERIDHMVKRIPLGRFGDLNDLKGVSAFLASREARYITGQIIFVDGGWTAA